MRHRIVRVQDGLDTYYAIEEKHWYGWREKTFFDIDRSELSVRLQGKSVTDLQEQIKFSQRKVKFITVKQAEEMLKKYIGFEYKGYYVHPCIDSHIREIRFYFFAKYPDGIERIFYTEDEDKAKKLLDDIEESKIKSRKVVKEL